MAELNVKDNTGIMRTKILLYSIFIWFIIAIAAVINGIFRVTFLEPVLSGQIAHIISTFILMAIILTISYLFVKSIIDICTRDNLIYIGIIWFLLTILFEFGFGHYVVNKSWQTLLADYNISEGRIWILIPITMLISPYLWGKILKKSKDKDS